MARTVLPIVGAAVGTFFGAPQIGFAIGSIVGNAVDPQRIKGPRIGDVNLQTSQEGAPRPIVYGTAAVMGNLIDRGPLEKVITEERQGKGGGPVVENESLFMTFAIRICEGPIDGISRIWEDEKLVYDVRPESQIMADSLRYEEGFNLYLGEEDQLPDPELEVIHGVGNTPAHRGSAYIVFVRKNLTDRRGSIPQFRFEVNGCIKRAPGAGREIVPFNPVFSLYDSIWGWNTDSIIEYPPSFLPAVRAPAAGIKTWIFRLNALLTTSTTFNSQYEIIVDNEVILTTQLFPIGSNQPKVTYLLDVQGASQVWARRIGGNYAAGSIYESSKTIAEIIAETP